MASVLRIGLALAALASGAANGACVPVDHDHAAWTALLGRHVGDGKVAYEALQRDAHPALEAYLASLSAACTADYVRWSRSERLAFWLNVYNAFTVQLVLDHLPITSIRQIGWLPGAAFRQRFIRMPELKGGTISLDDVEHGTIRKDFREPRIHFALVCASRGCPRLRAEAYRAAVLDAQLDDQARTFLRDATKNRWDPATRTLALSRIFEWFRVDFEAAAGSLPAYVTPYLGPVPADARIEFLDYDWTLNAQ